MRLAASENCESILREVKVLLNIQDNHSLLQTISVSRTFDANIWSLFPYEGHVRVVKRS
jgi:hypothetical protein